MRLSGTKTSSVNQYNGLGDQLYDLGGAKPTLDLNFASNGSLVDSVTGKTLVTHTRASNATYVDGDGIIKDAVTNLLLRSEEFDITWSDVATTVSSNTTTAPNGTLTADTLTDTNAAGDAYLRQSITNPPNSATYTGSIYLKQGTTTTTRVSLTFFGATTVNRDATITWSSSTTNYGTLTSVGNGWYRLAFSETNNASGNTSLLFTIRASGDVTGSETGTVFAWGAQLEQSSTAGEYVKTTTAINSAPRFDHDPTTGESLGLLVEESRTNLLLWSEELDAAAWSGAGGAVATAGTAIAPNGTATADTLTDTNGTTANAVVFQTVTLADSTTYTISCYLKAGTKSTARVGIRDKAGSYILSDFDLTAGTTSVGSAVSSSIQPVGSGWYRCIVVANSSTGATSQQGLIYLDTGSYTQDGTGTLLVWGAQLEAGSFPTSYIPTTSSTVTRAADVASIEGRNFGSVNLVQYSEEFDQWASTYTVVQPNALTAPNETQTADLLIDTTDNQQHNRAFTSTVTGTKTFSVYAKASSSSRLLRLIDYNPTDGAQSETYYNIETGVKLSGPGTITSAGNGWYRCSIQSTTTVTSTVYISLATSVGTFVYAGDGTSGLYLWGAQLEEGSTATDYIKSDVNWTSRASNATYYNVNGTLKKSSYNLLLQSEDFNEAVWLKNQVTIDPNVAIAPTGTMTADKATASGTDAYLQQYPITGVASGATLTASVWIKGEGSSIGKQGFIAVATNSGIGTPSTFTITENWQRVSVTRVTPVGDANGGVRIDFVDPSVIGDIVYLWGAQLETGTYAGDYAKTTTTAASTARTSAYLPDGNGNFVSAGDLLLEGAGTNLVPSSNGFSSFSVSDASRQSGHTGPDGSQDAYKVTSTTSAAYSRIFTFHNSTAGTVVTFSVYLKVDSGSLSQQACIALGSTTVYATKNITLTTDWQRFDITGTVPSDGLEMANPLIYLNPDDDSGAAVTGDYLYIFGAQLEQSAYPTSYIPTYGSTATRAADVSSSSSNTFGNSFYNQTEGTVFSAATTNATHGGTNSFPRKMSINDSNINYITEDLYRVLSNYTDSGYVIKVAGTNQASFDTNNERNGQKSSISYAVNDFAYAVGGSVVNTDSSGSLPTNTQLNIGTRGDNSSNLNGTISRLTYWPTRLSNDTLKTITA